MRTTQPWLLAGRLARQAAVAALPALLIAACGGKATVDGTSSEAGAGGSSSTTTGPGGTTTTTGTGGATTTTGTGGTTTTTGTGAAGGASPACDGLTYTDCLLAFPECVPQFDDACCPSCAPGPCEDCSDWQFFACVAADGPCQGVPPSCGLVPDWACAGSMASCDVGYCYGTPGCAQTFCPLAGPPCEPECHPATAASCMAICATVPPPCPDGTVPEADGACWTGFCIPAWVCGNYQL